MYLLGIESATPVASVAVVYRDKILSEHLINNKRTHSGHLLPMIKKVIEEAGINPGDIQAIAVSSGPGSFTGLRIGMSTAKTLAQVWQIPLVGVGTLAVLAHPLSGHANLVCPILNARKNEVYTSVFHYSEGCQQDLTGPLAIRPEKLAELLTQWPGMPVTFLGDGVEHYRETIIGLVGERALFAPGAVNLPRGSAVADLGLKELQKGRSSDLFNLVPNYVRLSEAEVKWQQKQQETEGI
ncbi:MAG: tRNA (adenosine(37)-N6)-threonylcarbamoyltransferase complex dimerization subunit type 1 TsaB [Peptococcaceae bacterium]|nr:tRNA (adenosine(37)-N6)-threonylcarbamoyltransferase complex dimerization subunit type 1 TsaB [Peptococcaceae bacterium]